MTKVTSKSSEEVDYLVELLFQVLELGAQVLYISLEAFHLQIASLLQLMVALCNDLQSLGEFVTSILHTQDTVCSVLTSTR